MDAPTQAKVVIFAACLNSTKKKTMEELGMKHKIHDVIQFLGNYTHPALDVHAENKIIDHDTGNVGAQHAENHGLAIVAQRRSQCHRPTGPGQRPTQIYMQELVHTLGHDIQAAGGGVTDE